MRGRPRVAGEWRQRGSGIGGRELRFRVDARAGPVDRWDRCERPRCDGVPNRAGVDPIQWAKDFLTRLGAPITASNVQAITAWETAEGTKAPYNPLAETQGGYAGETTFNSVGVKNYASYQDGLDANVQVINNGRYTNILAALHQGDNAEAVANSPWGTGSGVERVLAAEH